MTGKERMLNVLQGKSTDHVPVALHNFLLAGHMLKIPFNTYLQSGELLARAQLHSWHEFRHDVLMVENGVAAMAEALGCKIAYSVDQPPHVRELAIQNLEEIARLRIPDPETSFPLNEMLRAVRLIKKEVGDAAFLMGRADQGPMALAISIYGTEKLLMDIASQRCPEEVHALIEFSTRCTMRYASALQEAGADGTCIGGIGLSLVSPSIFREYELPYQKMFVEHCHSEGLLVGVHTCGYEDPILEDIVSSGADWLELDPLTTPELACESTKDRCGILGMISPTGVLLSGTKDEIAVECANRLRQMKGARFIIGPGCAIPADCPPGNIKVLVNSVKQNEMNIN